ncbi:MAG: NAD(P)-dependent oxidoreductase [Calditrichia bacterium]
MDNKKRIVVFGATGKTGRHVWQQALEQGHEVTVFVRSPQKIEHTDAKLHIVQGDVFDAEVVANAVANHDTAIVCLGSTSLSDKTTLTIGSKNVIDGMVRHNVGRLVILSAAGVTESWVQIGWLSRILFKTMLRNVFADHHTQEALIKESPLDWTIVRAAILKDEPTTGDYTVSNTAKVSHINRADVADFLVNQVTDTTYIKQAISITS